MSKSRHWMLWICGLAIFLGMICQTAHASPESFATHPPTRPLPTASNRPMGTGPARFVDPSRGDDAAAGSIQAPWKTLAESIGRIKPGETLYLRGGTYYESVVIESRGTAEAPITMRAYPGELAIIDGGLREFYDSPADAWEPFAAGAAGEYRSTRSYPELGSGAGLNVMGRFAESLLPLHGYNFYGDLQSDNPYWNVEKKTGAESFVYCGPGVWWNAESGRIHIRLAHTRLPGLGNDNYRGETDPRRLPLIIAGRSAGTPVTLHRSQFVRLQDLVIRGTRETALAISESADIEIDGLTLYGGSSAMRVAKTAGLRMTHTACRGIAAPWTFRGSLKYRSVEARIFSASGWTPAVDENRDFELAWCEFTDCVDGVFIGNVRGVRFHHNLVANVSDDGMFLTAGTALDGTTHGGDVEIYQNRFTRCLTVFAFGVGHGRQRWVSGGRQTGSGVQIYRNVIDLRRPVMYHWPSGPDAPQEIDSAGRITGDHGGPAWEPMVWRHNTILTAEPPFRAYYGAGLGASLAPGTSRRVFNNIFLQLSGAPGNVFQPIVLQADHDARVAAAAAAKEQADPLDSLLDGDLTAPAPQTKPKVDPAAVSKLKEEAQRQPAPPRQTDFQADGNLHWSLAADGTKPDLFQRFRGSPEFARSQQLYKAGWTSGDVIDDPRLVDFSADWRQPAAVLAANSPAVNAGIALPKDWPDPLQGQDAGAPDIGAIPAGAPLWGVGARGRLMVDGSTAARRPPQPAVPWAFASGHTLPALEGKRRQAVIVEGYPAFDAPLAAFALARSGFEVTRQERAWLPTDQYAQAEVVLFDGSLTRGKVEPSRYSAADLPRVKQFLQNGGTLILMRGQLDLFATPEGKAVLAELTGGAARETMPVAKVQLPRHAWVKHLQSPGAPTWLERGFSSLGVSQGECILGTAAGNAALARAPVGRGQIIHIGWTLSSSLPSGRAASTPEKEDKYEQQMQILLNIAAELAGR